MRDELETEYFLDVHEHQWADGIGRPAGIFWIKDRCVVAAHGSGAEQRLLEIGAIPVGTLRFAPHDHISGSGEN